MNTRTPRVTLKVIAEHCGYSVNTVSRALRGDEKLPVQTVEKIQNTAHELGYIRNNFASGLRSGRSNIIAIIVDDILNHHYSLLISQMDRLLKETGYEVMILITNLRDDLVLHMINVAISNSADGILFFPYTTNAAPTRLIRKHNIPFVLVDREIDNIQADLVCCNDYAGGYIAGKELCRLGHKRFLYVPGPEKNGSQIQRDRGFRAALAEHGFGADCIRTVTSVDKFPISADYREIIELLSPIDYTAIFVFNDQTAYVILNTLRAAGYRVPEDISVIGFDRLRQGLPYLPPLSTIACSSSMDMAQTAVHTLQMRIENPSLPYQRKILDVSFYPDGTAGEAPQAAEA